MELGSIAIGISLWSFCLLYFVEHCRTPLNQKEKMVADDIQVICFSYFEILKTSQLAK